MDIILMTYTTAVKNLQMLAKEDDVMWDHKVEILSMSHVEMTGKKDMHSNPIDMAKNILWQIFEKLPTSLVE